MGKLLKSLGIVIIIVAIAFGIFKLTNKYNLNTLSNNIDWSIYTKGCDNSVGFDFDDKNNLYIAYNNVIKIVNFDGKEDTIINDKTFKIYDIIWNKGKLLIATDTRVIEYDLESKTYEVLISNLPNINLENKIKLLLRENILYIAIGTNTNAGIVSEQGLKPDVPSLQWILSGKNYGEKKTGAFSNYGVAVSKGEKVGGSAIGNGTVMVYNLDNKETKLFAHGLKNINGWDFNSKNQLYGIVTGMEDIAPRNVKDDTDYIYQIKDQEWYGWPDFSGGDPITSPRFSDGNNKLDFVIENHPSNIPDAPIYQHSDLKALEGFAIDCNGVYFEKDTMIVGDNKNHTIYGITPELNKKALVELGDNSFIEKIKIEKDGFYILDSKSGCLYRLQSEMTNNIFNIPLILWVFIVIFLISMATVIFYKVKIKADPK